MRTDKVTAGYSSRSRGESESESLSTKPVGKIISLNPNP